MRLLIVEDNETQSLILRSMLNDHLVAVDLVTNGQDFRKRCAEGGHDALIIDLSLPDVDGLTLIEELRGGNIDTPIIVITGRSDIKDKVRCFESGADDYLVKPFSAVELLLRIRAVTRRAACRDGARLRVGDVAIDARSGLVTCRDAPMKLFPSEVKLLAHMAGRLNQVVTREDIAKLLGKRSNSESIYSAEKLVSRLRTTLDRAKTGLSIRTLRGNGYVLEHDVNPSSSTG